MNLHRVVCLMVCRDGSTVRTDAGWRGRYNTDPSFAVPVRSSTHGFKSVIWWKLSDGRDGEIGYAIDAFQDGGIMTVFLSSRGVIRAQEQYLRRYCNDRT